MKRVEINNFTGGVIKPRLFGRTDSKMYAAALREAVNVIVAPDGGLVKRPGNVKLYDANADTGYIRLEEFVATDGDRFILEFGITADPGYYVLARHSNGTGLSDAVTGCPWTTEAMLYDMHCVNENGTMYISHPSFGLYALTESATVFTLTPVSTYWSSTASQVKKFDDDTFISTSGADFQFYYTDVGQHIYWKNGSNYYKSTITSVTEVEYDPEAEADAQTFWSVAHLGTVTAIGAAPAWSTVAVSTEIPDIEIAPFDHTSAFLPGTVAFSGGRRYLSAFSGDKRKIYASCVNDPSNYRLGPADNFALEFTITDLYGSEVKWLQGGKEILIGTDSGILTVTAEGGLGATAIPVIIRQSDIPCSRIRPVIAGNLFVYPERLKKGIRGFVYQLQQDQYFTPSYSQMAEHLYTDEIRDITVLSSPFTIYFAVLDDGTAVTITMEPQGGIMAHTKQEFSGTLKSIAILHNTTGEEVWMAISKNGQVTIQKMQSIYYEGEIEDGVYLEDASVWTGASDDITSIVVSSSAITFDTTPTVFADDDFIQFTDIVCADTDLVTFLEAGTFKLGSGDGPEFALLDEDGDALELSGYAADVSGGTATVFKKDITAVTQTGEIEILGDGISYTDTVAGGAVAIDEYANKIIYGYPYSAYIRLLPLNVYPEGWIRVINVGVNVYRTTHLKIGENATDWLEMGFDDEIIVDTEPTQYSGVKRKSFTGGYESENDIYIGQDEAYPMNLLAAFIITKVEGE